MTTTQCECFIELSSFDDLARYACAFREYPQRVYSQEFDGSRIISSSLTLANTLLIFYAQMPKSGRYISYQVNAGKEICEIVESTKNISNYAPIVHMESKISDQFHPIQVKDLGSLARLTYDPEFPDEQNLTLYALPNKNSWIMGYITPLEMDDIIYNFNYVELDSEPTKHFIKYQGNQGRDPEFSDKFDHGYSYFPIIKIKNEHSIFGFLD